MFAMHTVHNLARPIQAGGMLGILFTQKTSYREIKMRKYA